MSCSLAVRLDPIAAQARRMLASHAAKIYRSHGGCVDRDEFHAFSLTAAFEAFEALGGTEATAGDFRWDARHTELCTAAVQALGRRLRSEIEFDNDETLRNGTRKSGHCNDELQWQVWRGDVTAHAPAPTCAPQDDEMREAELEALADELAQVLSPTDLELVSKHYFEGVSQTALAEALATVQASDVKKAERTVNTRMCRARAKLRDGLSDRWRLLATER